MKRALVCAALAMAVAFAVPGDASAWGRGGHFGGGHFGGPHFGGGFHHGFGGYRGYGGYRGWGWGHRWGGYYPAYYGPYGCWRWVAFPFWHRVWACY